MSRNIEHGLIEPQDEIEDNSDQLEHNSDHWHEHTYQDKNEAKAMERKINSFKRNRRSHRSFGDSAREARGDEDEVEEEEESDNEVRRNHKRERDDEEDF